MGAVSQHPSGPNRTVRACAGGNGIVLGKRRLLEQNRFVLFESWLKELAVCLQGNILSVPMGHKQPLCQG